ncbi:MAG TPA: helix-turn-helix transcriptional regulator, partial [Terriglobia bacterium]|nr:helix-turn-helix transcriptional regulator [Terriglobia bacterium]
LVQLRRQAGMTVRQLSEASGQPVAALNRYEDGHSLPRTETLRRVVEAMGATMMDLYRAQQGGGDYGARIEDGTLPPDSRMPAPAAPHKAAVRLAQECGKAVAHCCLAFLELQAGGWHDTEPTSTTDRARRDTHP